MKNYTNILIDADNTIFNFDKCEEVAIKLTFKAYNIVCDDDLATLYHKVNDMYWKKLEKKEVTTSELATKRFTDIFEKYSFDIDPVAFNKLYKQNLSHQNFLIDNAGEILRYLSSLNKKIIVASNGSRWIQESRINSSEIAQYISGIYTSEDAGVNKPATLFFDKLFSHFNIDKNDTILIGDSLTADIKGGYDYGLSTIFYSPQNVDNFMPTHTVTSLLQIKDIIK